MDSRCKRDGRVIEELGFYDPLVKEADKAINFNKDRAAYWLSVGALPTDTVRALLRKSGLDVKVRVDGKVM
jgi:small subunit ribosomal protein S16